MAGTIVVDRIESDGSYASTVNVASKVNFTGGMQIGGQDTTFAGMRNRIINGDMIIDQRNAGASVTLSNQGYGLDRWTTWFSQVSKYTIQQNSGSVDVPTGFRNYQGVVSTSAYSLGASDYFGIGQKIEGYNISDFAWGTNGAVPITISFWVRCSLTGTFGVVLRNNDGSRYFATTYTVNQSNTWEYKTITISGDISGTWNTTNGSGIFLMFGLGTGTNQTATNNNTWVTGGVLGAAGATNFVGTNGATFYITGVQLEKGYSATAFEHRMYVQELALCQRYYEKTFALNVVPQLGASSTENSDPYNAALLFAGHRSQQPSGAAPPSGFRWKVPKRASPSIASYGNSAGAIAYRTTVAAGVSWYGGANLGFVGTDQGLFLANEFTSDAFVQVIAHFTASSEL
jgi:hypothetical protein